MTITTPTGQLFTDLVIFGLFVGFSLAVVLIGTAIEQKKKGKN